VSTDERRALVVGAGPGGLTTAIGLQRAGIRAEVFEQAPEIKPIGAGVGVQSNALKALLRIGVGRSLFARGADIRSLDVYSSDDRLLAQFPQGEISDEFGLPTLSVLRGDLQFELVDALEEGTLHLGARCVEVQADGDGATVRFADGREERGALVVGADGVDSAVKRAVIGDAGLRYSGYCGWRAWVQPPTPVMPPGHCNLIIGRGCAFVMFPTADGLYWGCMRKTAPGGTDGPGIRAELLEYTRRFPERARIVVGAATDEGILRTDIYDRDPSDTWSKGRAVLVGDAIHPTAPFVGQGAGIAIEDGVVLAKELSLTHGLRDRSMIEAAFEAYQARRAGRAHWMVMQGRRRGQLCSFENPVLCGVRNALLRLMPASVWKRQLRELVQYDV
jgi:2-polyprenyl-6-methoxyphenol hydroxylase-like FAD-dependent oxidoreductase